MTMNIYVLFLSNTHMTPNSFTYYTEKLTHTDGINNLTTPPTLTGQVGGSYRACIKWIPLGGGLDVVILFA